MFEGRLVLNPGLNLTRVSFLMFKSIFLDNFLCCFWEHLIINLLTKRIKLNLLFKLSYLNSNFALTLGYFNPALNNPALMYQRITGLHFNDSLQVILAARFIWIWHSNNTTTLRFEWKTWFVFRTNHMILHAFVISLRSLKMLFHVWNLILFKGQKYHQGSLAYFIFYSKTSVQNSFVQCPIFLCVPCDLTCGLWPVTWPVTCGL